MVSFFGRVNPVAILMVLLLGASAGVARGSDTRSFRAVTYNIAMGIPLRAERTASRAGLGRTVSMGRLLTRHPDLRDFDVLGVQEICANGGGWQLRYFEDWTRKMTGRPHVSSVFARSDPKNPKDCETGQALFSPHPIVASGEMPLPQIRNVGKVMLWAELELPSGRRVRVYNIHLDNRGRTLFAESGRLVQMTAVLERIQMDQAAAPERGIVLLGDFNTVGYLVDVWRREKSIRAAERVLRNTLRQGVPTYILGWHLDWIFYEGPMALLKARVVPRVLSDHYPVVADFIVD